MLRKGLPTRLQMVIEAEHGRPWRDVVLNLMYDEQLTQELVAERLEVTQQTISSWLRQIREEDATREPAESIA